MTLSFNWNIVEDILKPMTNVQKKSYMYINWACLRYAQPREKSKKDKLSKSKKGTCKQTNEQQQQQQQQQAKTERKEQHVIIVNDNSSSDKTKI